MKFPFIEDHCYQDFTYKLNILLLFIKLAATPLEASNGTLGRVVVPSPKIVVNFPRTHENLSC